MIRRVRQDLFALFGSMEHPAFATCASWGCAALAYHAYPLATKGGYGGAVGAAFVFCLPLLFLAYWLGAGALAFALDAQRSCLPGSQRLARRAKFLASALLLPALVPPVAALAASPLWPAWVPTMLVLAIALAEVLAPLLPISAVGLFLLAALAGYWAASARTDHERGMALSFALFSAALALLALAKWHRAIRQGPRAPGLAERVRAICIRIGPRGRLEREPRGGGSPQGSWDRQPPVQIIRACFGGMFVQLSMRPAIIGAVLLALFMLTVIGLPRLGASGWRWAVSTLALVAAGLVSAGFLTQISKLTRAQLAELALMPGLGPPAAQRRALCSAVLSPPLPWLGIVLLLGSAGLLFKGEPLSSVGVLAVCVLILWLIYTLLALQKLVTLPPKRQSFISEFLLLYIFVYLVYPIYAAHALMQILHLFWWAWVILVLIGVGIAGAIGFSVRRLATAPHPFLS